MNSAELQLIVAGAINVDIYAHDIARFPQSGEQVYGRNLTISAGGKSRNIAEMVATLMGPGHVALLGRSHKDEFGLWKVPFASLEKVGVDIRHVQITEGPNGENFPGAALIAVTTKGENQIYYIPGANAKFSPEDVSQTEALFQQVGQNQGFLQLSLEQRIDTLVAAAQLAKKHGLRTFVDAGGITPESNYTEILSAGIELIKPNEQEVQYLTGITVTDEASAMTAAHVFFHYGIKNVFITHGARDAYLINANGLMAFPVPTLPDSADHDETGCGDQVMATLLASLIHHETLEMACKRAIVAGALQFQKSGIIPIASEEILKFV